MGAYYIVTDLVLRARFDLAALNVELLEAGLHGGVNFYQGVWSANYSSSKRGCRIPCEALDELLGIVENLSEESRTLWDRCKVRRFDLGFQCFDERHYARWQVKAPLLMRLAAVNGNLVVTICRDDSPVDET
jgi:hypothetical protein